MDKQIDKEAAEKAIAEIDLFDAQELTKRPLNSNRLRTEDCPTLFRFDEIINDGEPMTEDEDRHIASGCAYCAKLVATFRAEQAQERAEREDRTEQDQTLPATIDDGLHAGISQDAASPDGSSSPPAVSIRTYTTQGVIPSARKNNTTFWTRPRLSLLSGLAATLIVASVLLLHRPAVRQPLDRRLLVGLGLNGDTPALLAQASKQLDDSVLFSGTRGGDTSPDVRLLSPVNTYVVNIRPTLRWEASSGVTVKEVQVLSGGSVWDHASAPSGSSWQVGRALEPDRRYAWQVTVARDGTESSASALLYVPRADVLVAMQRDLKALTPLQKGVLYLEAGQLRPAQQQFQTALSQETAPENRRRIEQVLARIQRQVSGGPGQGT